MINSIAAIFFIFFTNSAFSATFNTYKLLNNSVQAVFSGYPDEVDVSNLPQAKQFNMRSFRSIDASLPVMYTLQARDFEQDKEVGAYNDSFKAMEDESIRLYFLNYGGSISEFSSSFDRKNNIYTAEISGTTKYSLGYRSELIVIYKKKVYNWAVIYSDKNLKKTLFDNYKQNFKILYK
jgi:hypothetical protein